MTAASPVPGRLLGIDHGLKVIGLAVSDPTGLLARPLQLLHRTSKQADFAVINTILTEQDAAAVIVGLPESPPHITAHTQADTVRLWASRLATATPVPVYLWNERYSSQDAEDLLTEAGRPRPERIDAVAAAVILQSFLDALRAGAPWPDPVSPADESAP
ncbi:MAG: Holliday junction resolvase RuvX [Anaerolineae bacterium]|jgi:putative Holliday junction resolvase|nr:Holliday junction resolvase RuvX [Anaerolineae bacterium]